MTNITVALSRMLRNGGAEIFLRDIYAHMEKCRIRQCICVSDTESFDQEFADTFPFPVYLGSGQDIDNASRDDDVILVWGNVLLNQIAKIKPRVCVFNACAARKEQIACCDKFVTHVISSSTFAREAVANGFRDTLILPGVNPERLATKVPGLRSELGYKDNEIVVGSTCRLDRNKRPDWIVKAVEGSGPNIKGLIVGEGPEMDRLKAMGSDKTLLVGHRENVGDYYACMDIFCLPSASEGCSASLFEAMFMRLPPIVTNVGSAPDIITNGVNGFLADDPQGIVSAIEILKDEKVRKNTGEKAYDTAREKGHISETAKKWEELFLRLHQRKKTFL